MLIHPFLSKRKGNNLVAHSDSMGFVSVSAFKTLKGAKAHATRVSGVVEGKALTAAKPSKILKHKRTTTLIPI